MCYKKKFFNLHDLMFVYSKYFILKLAYTYIYLIYYSHINIYDIIFRTLFRIMSKVILFSFFIEIIILPICYHMVIIKNIIKIEIPNTKQNKKYCVHRNAT